MTITYLVDLLVRFIYNKLSKSRIMKLSDNLWNDDVSDVEIKKEDLIAAFSKGMIDSMF